MTKTPSVTVAQFDEIRTKLRSALLKRLQEEMESASDAPELGDDEDSDLWDLPTVDSKTVIKTSGVVKKFIGMSLPPDCVRKGGYQTTEEAVDHVLSELRARCPITLKGQSSTKVLNEKVVAS